MPSIDMSSEICCTARSASPEITLSAVKPAWIAVAFAPTASAMSRRSMTSRKWMPLALLDAEAEARAGERPDRAGTEHALLDELRDRLVDGDQDVPAFV